MATIVELPSGNWRVQIRRKDCDASQSFRRRRDAEIWATEMERRVDRGESISAKHPTGIRTFADLIDFHIADMREVKNAAESGSILSRIRWVYPPIFPIYLFILTRLP